MQESRRKEHGAQRGSGSPIVHVTQLMGDVDENGVKPEIKTCKHFLVGSDGESETQSLQLYHV